MTFSIVARCPKTGQLGGAVSSSSPAVAARCLHARAGVGVVMSQNITDPMLGKKLLDGLQQGLSAQQAMDKLTQSQSFIAYRQLVALGKVELGANHPISAPAVFNGAHTLGVFAHAMGDHVACAGNLLANTEVPHAMMTAFQQASGTLAQRILIAMQAGLDAGGEAGPVHSAGLMVMDKVDWAVVDLRVDWSDNPIADLHKAWQVYQPQLADYVTRATDPRDAPSYGVPGDE